MPNPPLPPPPILYLLISSRRLGLLLHKIFLLFLVAFSLSSLHRSVFLLAIDIWSAPSLPPLLSSYLPTLRLSSPFHPSLPPSAPFCLLSLFPIAGSPAAAKINHTALLLFCERHPSPAGTCHSKRSSCRRIPHSTPNTTSPPQSSGIAGCIFCARSPISPAAAVISRQLLSR